jgi:hypothetical protein
MAAVVTFDITTFHLMLFQEYYHPETKSACTVPTASYSSVMFPSMLIRLSIVHKKYKYSNGAIIVPKEKMVSALKC